MKLSKSVLADYIKLKYDANLTWRQICDIIWNEQRQSFTVGEISKWASLHKEDFNDETAGEEFNQLEMNLEHEEEKIDVEPSPIENKILELQKAKVRLSDERIQNNANVRLLARIDSLKEIAEEAAKTVALSKPFIKKDNRTPYEHNKFEMTICLSDWHYGISVDNPFNRYNPDIAKERIAKLLDSIIEIYNVYEPPVINIINLGDLISGRIHSTIRLNNRIDAITQVMEVSELVAEFINSLYENVPAVINYWDAIDNHSRIEPNLKESLDSESLVRIIHWYLKQRFAGFDDLGVNINDNTLGPEFVTYEILNKWKVIGVHGHNDKIGSIVKNLTLLTKDKYDMVLTAHMHHPAMEEENQVVVVQNGSLMGVDDYSSNLRCSSYPSQNVIISTVDTPIFALHTIRL